MDGVLKIEPMSARQIAERLANEGRDYKGVRPYAFKDGSKWVFDNRFNHWACTSAPDSTGQFKLLTGAL